MFHRKKKKRKVKKRSKSTVTALKKVFTEKLDFNERIRKERKSKSSTKSPKILKKSKKPPIPSRDKEFLLNIAKDDSANEDSLCSGA